MRIVVAAAQLVAVDEPEGTGEEDAFSGGQAVDAGLCPVADDQPVLQKLALDGGDRPLDTHVVASKETDERHEQEARVELAGAVRLHERAE